MPFPPVEPPATRVAFPDPRRAAAREVLAVGADFSPGTLLAAYRLGIFPWPHSRRLVPWMSPDPRAVFPIDREPHWSRSLRRTLRKHPWEITVDVAFESVMRACGETRAEGTWILPEMVVGYVALHRAGFAHSVEVWEKLPAGGRVLVGGIYGIAIGGAFAGESMFHTQTDASKVAFAHLAIRLRASGFSLFDVQVMNDHLASLGCVEIRRATYLQLLDDALAKGPVELLA